MTEEWRRARARSRSVCLSSSAAGLSSCVSWALATAGCLLRRKYPRKSSTTLFVALLPAPSPTDTRWTKAASRSSTACAAAGQSRRMLRTRSPEIGRMPASPAPTNPSRRGRFCAASFMRAWRRQRTRGSTCGSPASRPILHNCAASRRVVVYAGARSICPDEAEAEGKASRMSRRDCIGLGPNLPRWKGPWYFRTVYASEAMRMNCSACGSANDVQARFCSGCGSELAKRPPDESRGLLQHAQKLRTNRAPTKNCASCGSGNEPKARCCSSYGTRFRDSAGRYDIFVSYRRDGGSHIATALTLLLERDSRRGEHQQVILPRADGLQLTRGPFPPFTDRPSGLTPDPMEGP